VPAAKTRDSVSYGQPALTRPADRLIEIRIDVMQCLKDRVFTEVTGDPGDLAVTLAARGELHCPAQRVQHPLEYAAEAFRSDAVEQSDSPWLLEFRVEARDCVVHCSFDPPLGASSLATS
jgi:hypothetical protein